MLFYWLFWAFTKRHFWLLSNVQGRFVCPFIRVQMIQEWVTYTLIKGQKTYPETLVNNKKQRCLHTQKVQHNSTAVEA
jgi:hypothetical protein